MKIMNNTMEEEWCLFQHTNVGHELTKQTSPVYACFPAVPPKVEIQIPCPNNSSGYHTNQNLMLKCQEDGKWATQEGNCGCYSPITT